ITQANTPQLALSIAYYLWNIHLNVMLAAREYDSYAASTRRSLRVTNPEKESAQQATTIFMIPFKYWITNSFLCTVLSWLASQSLFFVRVDMINHWQQMSPYSISQVGYSIMGIICFVAVSACIFTFSLWISTRKLKNRMPLAATCSGALSAACHPTDSSLRHHEKKIHWGIEKHENGLEDEEIRDDETRPFRCTFTSLEARYPYPDRFYA
ncbi:hypothetical protein CC80DRAFT_400871, partial [Byssothecium circinans]